jgi:hypothetical protein
LGIQSSSQKKKSYDFDLDAFMNPASGSISGVHNTTANVQQLINTAK